MKKTLFKMFMALVLMLSFGGCATGGSTGSISSASAGNVKDFNSAIHAYDLKKDMAYLKSASKYAATDSEKAILERKLVDYLGADKVFEVQITNSLGTQKGYSYAGLITGGKGSKQNVKIFIKVTPRQNLPFTLKYNSYKISFVLKRETEYRTHGDFKKASVKKLANIIEKRDFTLSPANQWKYNSQIKDKVVIYAKSAGFLHSGSQAKLQKLIYHEIINIYPSNAILFDPKTGTQWQNFYPTTGNKVKTVKVSSHKSGDVARKYCKNLKLDGKGWSLPSINHLKSLSGNQSLLHNMKETNLWYSERGYSHYNNAIRLSDRKIRNLNKGDIVGIRCMKSRIYDKTTGLEWDNTVYQENYPQKAKEYCKNLGSGWRLPTPREQSTVIKNNMMFFTSAPKFRKHNWWTSRFDPNLRNPSIPASVVTQNGTIKTQRKASSFYQKPFRCVRRK